MINSLGEKRLSQCCRTVPLYLPKFCLASCCVSLQMSLLVKECCTARWALLRKFFCSYSVSSPSHFGFPLFPCILYTFSCTVIPCELIPSSVDVSHICRQLTRPLARAPVSRPAPHSSALTASLPSFSHPSFLDVLHFPVTLLDYPS